MITTYFLRVLKYLKHSPHCLNTAYKFFGFFFFLPPPLQLTSVVNTLRAINLSTFKHFRYQMEGVKSLNQVLLPQVLP